MFIICWEDNAGEKLWEVVSGEDAMQIRVDEIVKSGILSEDVVVGELIAKFNSDTGYFDRSPK